MHTVEVKGILSAKNGMNLYRGCSHGCIYCDSRSHCYQMMHDFEDIEVKDNAIELLESALRRKRKKCMIGTGAMSDPYIPLEQSLEHTRKSLELIEKYGFGIAIQTKSDRILRDIDLLDRINQKTKAVVQMTLTTYDEALCKVLEPGVSTTRERFGALEKFKERGIPTVVWLTPILPFINDTVENIDGILDYCEAAGVKGILSFGMGVTLRSGNREYFYRALDRHFPGLKAQYIRTYGEAYSLRSAQHDVLMARIRQRCQKMNILCDTQRIFDYLNTFEEKRNYEQLSFFDA